jgi:hypothetical protein
MLNDSTFITPLTTLILRGKFPPHSFGFAQDRSNSLPPMERIIMTYAATHNYIFSTVVMGIMLYEGKKSADIILRQ